MRASPSTGIPGQYASPVPASISSLQPLGGPGPLRKGFCFKVRVLQGTAPNNIHKNIIVTPISPPLPGLPKTRDVSFDLETPPQVLTLGYS